MANPCKDVAKALEAILPRRKARQVADSIDHITFGCTCGLDSMAIPATHLTDLGSTPEKVVARFGKVLTDNGARLVR